MDEMDGPEIDGVALAALMAGKAAFESLGPADLDRLLRHGRMDTVPAGTRLFAQGDIGEHAFLVVSGGVEVAVDSGAGPVTVAVLGPGHLVGEVAAFARVRRTAHVSVARAGPARLLRIDRDTLRAVQAQSPDTLLAIVAELGARLQGQNGALAVMIQATQALAAGEFRPEMLDALKGQASRYAHFAEAFEDMAAELTAKRALRQEMRTAAEIQASFLPRPLPAAALAGRAELAAAMTPAADVGGDFYDYFLDGDRSLCLAVGDVSGKGVPASMFMSVSRTVLKALARQGGDAGTVLARMNAQLAEDNPEQMFVTVAFARLDLDSGAVELACGGHEEAFLRRADGHVAQIGARGPAIGLFPDARFPAARLTLTPGDTLVLATDGITEAFGPGRAMFGTDRLLACLAAGGAPEALVAGLQGAVAGFAAGTPQSDDITCLALRYLGPPG